MLLLSSCLVSSLQGFRTIGGEKVDTPSKMSVSASSRLRRLRKLKGGDESIRELPHSSQDPSENSYHLENNLNNLSILDMELEWLEDKEMQYVVRRAKKKVEETPRRRRVKKRR